MTDPMEMGALPPGFNPMRDLPQDSLIRSLRLMAPMFGHGPRESNALYAADELERVILEKRWLIHLIQNAPHEDRCPSAQNEPGMHFTDECTCWKAALL